MNLIKNDIFTMNKILYQDFNGHQAFQASSTKQGAILCNDCFYHPIFFTLRH